jgi:hypothetical protein
VAPRLEHGRREPPSDDRTGNEPDQRKRSRDESLLSAAKSQQSSESEHDPVKPGHEAL